MSGTTPPASSDSQRTVVGAGKTPASKRESKSSDLLERGANVGRFVVLDRLGAGGMGVVYAAYDPELDRKVALKLLRTRKSKKPTPSEAEGTGGRTRLVREAQALAKLSHPNVVAIYDVGTLDDRVWLAMEHIEGQTVTKWVAKNPRTWREVLDVFLAAGRGLAAAHASDLIHRDVKPDNIMVGDDGRVRVMDLGLARATNTRPATPLADGEALTTGRFDSLLSADLTQEGRILGTPAYMAPEQLLGHDVDPAADQFAFCIALWEALYGERPFRAKNLPALALAVVKGKLSEPPNDKKVPTWLRRTITRGLSVKPDKRWPSMIELLEELEQGLARGRKIRNLGIAAALAVLPGAAWGVQALEEGQRERACVAAGEEIDAMWGTAQREAVRSGIAQSGVHQAELTAEKVMPWLDRWADAWRETRTQTCRETTLTRQWNEDLAQRADECLDEHAIRFTTLTGEMEESAGREGIAARAVETAANLEDPTRCGEPDYLRRRSAWPKERVEEFREVLRETSRATNLRVAGDHERSLELAVQAAASAEEIGLPALIASAALTEAGSLDVLARYEEAEERLERAYVQAGLAGSAETEAMAAIQLTYVVGYRRAQLERGRDWAKVAEVAVARAEPGGDGLLTANQINNLAVVESVRGDEDVALELHERALEIRRKRLGPDHPAVARSLNNIANIHRDHHGDHAAAIAKHEQALAIRERAFGPEHPLVSRTLNNTALVYQDMGDYERAKSLYRRALRIDERTRGKEHVSVAMVLNNLANVSHSHGELEDAIRFHERALAIREKALGPDHPDVAQTLNNLANVYQAQERYREALELHERVLRIFETALGADHVYVGHSLNNQAAVRLELGELALATELYERCRTIWANELGEDHRDLSHPAVGLARVALAAGDSGRALPLAERGLALREGGSSPPEELAEARFTLARALVDTDPERARGLAEQARANYEALPRRNKEVREIDAWLEPRFVAAED